MSSLEEMWAESEADPRPITNKYFRCANPKCGRPTEVYEYHEASGRGWKPSGTRYEYCSRACSLAILNGKKWAKRDARRKLVAELQDAGFTPSESAEYLNVCYETIIKDRSAIRKEQAND